MDKQKPEKRMRVNESEAAPFERRSPSETLNTRRHEDGTAKAAPFKRRSPSKSLSTQRHEDQSSQTWPFKKARSNSRSTRRHDDESCNVPSRDRHLQRATHSDDNLSKGPSTQATNPLPSVQLNPRIAQSGSSWRGPGNGKNRSIFARLIGSGIVSENEPVFYQPRVDRPVMKKGVITRSGVVCNCCSESFSMEKFEVHAGSTLRKPSVNMFLTDGRSVMECRKALSDTSGASLKQGAVITSGANQKPSTAASSQASSSCEICGDSRGNLVLCDGCSAAFHASSCLNLDMIPEGRWYCWRCRCGQCGSSLESGGTAILTCAQCSMPYHRTCLVIENLEKEGPGPWFCARTCKQVFIELQQSVGHKSSLNQGLSWMLLRSSEAGTRLKDRKRRIIVDNRLSEAFELLKECFTPDSESVTNLLSQVVYSRTSANNRRCDCTKFYTFILMKEGGMLVCAATVRTHGNGVAEMPFVGTSHKFRNQGMCKALMLSLESLLRRVGISKLIVPSIPAKVAQWRRSFGFKRMSTQDRRDTLSGAVLLTFPRTVLLQKVLHG